MSTSIHIVTSARDLREFIYLPARIHKEHKNWLPPLYGDEWKFYKPEYNLSLNYSDTILLLSKKNGRLTGRIMGIINHKYNELHRERTGRFFNFDCFEDDAAAHELLQAVQQWAKEKGMNSMIGPFGFSDKDPQGLQVEGFEHLPVIATPANLPYLNNFVEREGFIKAFDCISYRLDVPAGIPQTYSHVYAHATDHYKYKVIEFSSKKELRPYIIPVLQLMNETYRNIYGFLPLEEKEMKLLADRYLLFLDPDFTKVVVDEENKPVAFVVASPDVSRGIIKSGGRLFPFGFIYILRSMAVSRQLDLFLGGVAAGSHAAGSVALLGVKLLQAAHRRGMKVIDSHLILESNRPMRNILERLGAIVYKKYRVYKKEL